MVCVGTLWFTYNYLVIRETGFVQVFAYELNLYSRLHWARVALDIGRSHRPASPFLDAIMPCTRILRIGLPNFAVCFERSGEYVLSKHNIHNKFSWIQNRESPNCPVLAETWRETWAITRQIGLLHLRKSEPCKMVVVVGCTGVFRFCVFYVVPAIVDLLVWTVL